MGPTPNSIRKISTTPWKAPATLPGKPMPPRKMSPRPPSVERNESGERNERGEANGSSGAIGLGDGSGATDRTRPREESYVEELEETDGAAPREFSSSRRGASFSARFHTGRL